MSENIFPKKHHKAAKNAHIIPYILSTPFPKNLTEYQTAAHNHRAMYQIWYHVLIVMIVHITAHKTRVMSPAITPCQKFCFDFNVAI